MCCRLSPKDGEYTREMVRPGDRLPRKDGDTLATTINAELAEPAEKPVLFCEFCGFCVDCRAAWRRQSVGHEEGSCGRSGLNLRVLCVVSGKGVLRRQSLRRKYTVIRSRPNQK